MQVQRVVCFGAAALQACMSVPFFMSFVSSVYIDGVNLDHTHFARLLSCASMLNRHSTVLLYARKTPDQPALQLNKYRWSHKTVRPWGEELPLQCPECGSIASLKIKAGQGADLHGTCEMTGCPFTRTYTRPNGHTAVKSVEQGAWLVSVEGGE
ncbi:hypothetical protein K466DRAFT_608040 [Polyporus arcularius HHB13444]|uniref:Uncharacterized protein n=1 Tax=Polyporus arcularius HHB13444 TaxID=1314778 RepID=A0A5C3NMP3_9APHY|nr:hypothetical protein K466DRAFT_608040 [Polyporus arcularius HHB13444]